MNNALSEGVAVIRANLGPLTVAAGLLLLADVHRFATYDPAVPGLTWGGVLRMSLVILSGGLATLVGCWAVFTGGRAGGFQALLAFPAARLLPFAGFAMLFYLWFFALSAMLVKLGAAIVGADAGLGGILILAAIHTAILIFMYLQLGFVFPDVAISGESGIILAMALGFASARKILAAIWPTALILTLPQAALAWVIFDAAALARLAETFPAIGVMDWVAAALLAAMSIAATVIYAAAMTRIFIDISPAGRFQSAMWN